ncbi:hypothetical protein SSP35_01_07350 [Streptomyces sp. NBRC 110611]|nr:hypothetical protein SSP35_01_07350 [Streptomyces sp. NBRC 110611]
MGTQGIPSGGPRPHPGMYGGGRDKAPHTTPTKIHMGRGHEGFAWSVPE